MKSKVSIFFSPVKDGKTCVDVAAKNCRELFLHNRQMKVVILGVEEVGKTSIVKRLKKEWSLLDSLASTFSSNGTRTDGVEIHQWIQSNGLSMNEMRLFDFGGQEI